MPFLKFSRDKRGYEYVYLVHAANRRGRPSRPRILYWYRSPPGIKVGRKPFDDEIRRTLEAQNPGVVFDWKSIIATPMPSPEPEPWRERRRWERVARESTAVEDPTALARTQAVSEESQLDISDSQDGTEELDVIAEPAEFAPEYEVPVERDAALTADVNKPVDPAAATSANATSARRRRRRGGRRRHRQSAAAAGVHVPAAVSNDVVEIGDVVEDAGAEVVDETSRTELAQGADSVPSLEGTDTIQPGEQVESTEVAGRSEALKPSD